MKGYLDFQHNVKVSQRRVGQALHKVAPHYQTRRQTDTARLLNPIPYRADYFGHKLHIDQNEKLVMYGATHVIGIDGHSRFIVACKTMPIKNNKIIYEHIYCEAIKSHGLFDQIRVDHGKEFYLMLGMQEQLANYHQNQSMLCHRQTQSKKNLPIERFWKEVNTRVNYPIKTALVHLDNSNVINLDDELHKYCISWLTCIVSSYGIKICTGSWNKHPIADRGIPEILKNRTTRTIFLSPLLIPSPDEAVEIYETTFNGRLTEESPFGLDPLKSNQLLTDTRQQNFDANFDISGIFGGLVNAQYADFENALVYYITETQRLSAFV